MKIHQNNQKFLDITKQLLLKNGRLLDLNSGDLQEVDIVIIGGIIRQLGKIEIVDFQGEILDLTGAVITPGLFDMHVHFREPGDEHKETLMTGADAAMADGFTAVCTMPNTDPATDNPEIVESIKRKFEQHLLEVYPVAAISKGRLGRELVDMAELKRAGAVAFSDDGSPVTNTRLMRQAMRISRELALPIIEHCEDTYLFQGGAMHEGEIAEELGLPGIPALAEELMVARNIMLAEETGGRLHIAHVSTAGSVELIRRAKEKRLKITCEVAPHHFSLTHEAVKTYGTDAKMNPPLRTRKDVDAILSGLKDGTIDVIASDHAPHTAEEKNQPFIQAPFGIIGLETMLGLTLTKLVRPGVLSLAEAIRKMSWQPANILGLEPSRIELNAMANLCFFNPEVPWKVSIAELKSKSKNTPFEGWTLFGKVRGVVNKNRILVMDSQKP
ncbi:dihydroorotase [candidate division KSB1 bacterium]|nr:dihydroorotase [candidate division KSB1 bacterium]